MWTSISYTICPTDLLYPSPAPHFKTFQVFLICFSKCPKFQHHSRPCTKCNTLLVHSLNLSSICWWEKLRLNILPQIQWTLQGIRDCDVEGHYMFITLPMIIQIGGFYFRQGQTQAEIIIRCKIILFAYITAVWVEYKKSPGGAPSLRFSHVLAVLCITKRGA